MDAASHLTENFLWVVQRTRKLYVEIAREPGVLPPGRDEGYFEPACLFFCWCDYLGALYLGQGNAASKDRVVAWLRSTFMTERNQAYRGLADRIHEQYRNGLVHAYAPRAFRLAYDHPDEHLTGSPITLDIPTLLDDFEQAVRQYADSIQSRELRRDGNPSHGSLEAFTNAVDELSA